MKRVFQSLTILVVLVVGATCALAAPKQVYVRTDGTRVRSGTSVTDTVIATLERGIELSVTGSKGGRYEVRLPDGRQGYVPRLKVSTSKPREARSSLMSMGTSSIGVTESDSVASLRGLSEAAKKLVASGDVSAQAVQWVEKMEANSKRVDKKEVRKFLDQGKVGF